MSMKSVRVLALVGVVGITPLVVHAGKWQQKPSVEKPVEKPVLSELDRLKVVTVVQAMELAQLRVQLAVQEFQRAKAEHDQVVASLSMPGWELVRDVSGKVDYAKKDGKTGSK